ncbi:type II secretion system F family protein [Janibacter sp. G349]|jgi:pilus assembly protein TadC|uniref:type II secretion system F family protein n=1 Tax=unclassified Janibacter TaxID=2649294 RepID=UPI0020CBAC9A|nr:type II secretion system F family protein [Janibacter sp. CX7]UTT65628.1 type II secretion system F family protein [Janibacter sp. CX7]
MTLPVLLLVVAAVVLWPSRSRLVDVRRREVDRASAQDPPQPLTVDDVADASVLLALALQSGRGLVQALEEVADVAAEGAAADLRKVAAALRWGRPMGRAWGYARRVWGPTATAFVVADAVGAPSASVLLDAAATLRDTEARRLEAAGGRAAVMLVLPLGLCFLPAFIATAVVPVVVVLVGTQLG